MAPSVLTRVIGPKPIPFSTSLRASPPKFRPALLPHHRRHRVRHADYPAVRPVEPSTNSSVRGTLVTGLTPTDMHRLDIFEGAEYERRPVRVKLLPDAIEDGGGIPEPLAYGGIAPATPVPGGVRDADGQEWADAETYIWIAPEGELEDEEWDFEVFRREKLHLWAGRVVEDEGMREVDEKFGSGSAGEVDGTRGRSVVTGEFEKTVKEDAVRSGV